MNQSTGVIPPASAANEPRRLEALHASGLLDSLPEEAYDRFTRLASRILGVPVALISLVDDARQFFKSSVGLAEPWRSARETPLSHSFCQHVVRTSQPLVVADAREHALVRENLAIPELGVVAYLGVPIRLNSGEVIGSFCAIDGTARRWNEEDLQTMRDLVAGVVAEIELRSALRSQEEVMAIVSHDLKNPIGAVQLGAEMLMRKVERGQVSTPAEMLPTIKRLRGLGLRMEALVREVLDQARVDNGPIPLNLQPENARTLILECLEGVVTQAAEKGVKIDLAADLGDYTLRCDRSRICQVVGNLVANAVEYTPAGKTVSVRAERTAEGLRLIVADEGPGIPPENREKIFRKFWRATGSAGKGHGLGLFIARKLIEAHGGSIVAGEAPSGGASLQLELPEGGRTPRALN